MNPPTFFGSKVDEDPQNFIDEVFKIVDAMGVTPREEAELASYQLKDVAQVWFEQWRDERPIVADPIDWGVFKMAFLDRFFPLELREQKARVNKFVMGVFGLVEEECRTAMLHHDMDISRLMVYAQQLEETKLRKMNRDIQRARPDEQNQSRSKKRFYNQDSLIVNNDRVSNPKPQRGNGGGSTFERPRCATCGKQHLGKCLAGIDGYFGCGSKGHKMRDCPTLKVKGKEINQIAHDGPDPNAPKKNRFYMLQANKD
ncbi:uncharacterized protein LOC125829339 [Solanum verrucosum]|uniref:uncharacterized protein LOC125829339 n=1 Tax=Solanum verrucosum TaxID=315347 RepID=UPI0020D1880D|nr:uncharacterized protein LOC125829339 [Solanum verrucosum]